MLPRKAGYCVPFKISLFVNGKPGQLRRVAASNRIGTLGKTRFLAFSIGCHNSCKLASVLSCSKQANYGTKLLAKKTLRARARWTVLSRCLLVPQALSSNSFASITIYRQLRKDGRLSISLEKVSCCWPHYTPFSMWNVCTIQLYEQLVNNSTVAAIHGKIFHVQEIQTEYTFRHQCPVFLPMASWNEWYNAATKRLIKYAYVIWW